MRIIKKISKWLLILLGIITLALVVLVIYAINIADLNPPKIQEKSGNKTVLKTSPDSLYTTLGDNWITKNQYGLYEMYISGSPYERGIKAGTLSQSLIQSQEFAFTHQLQTMIPSNNYMKFLKYAIGFINRGITDHITPEYQQEIYGISQFANKDSFNWVGDNYTRLTHYHAAHDVGHALSNLMLVGCSSFGTWGSESEDSGLIIGRNFDFWVGDEFAQNKIVEFVAPDSGYNFAYITWGGFIGVVSGMNDQGLTVTLNAAPSDIPYHVATPVSLVAREILQYAKNIEEAKKIAGSRKMFVSETFLIGSALDKKAVILEKTPNEMDIVISAKDRITCTNHFQGHELKRLDKNMSAMVASASVYRQNRMEQLINENLPLNPQKAAKILRDPFGINNQDIGLGNELAMNQFIAHHSIIMKPEELKMWVSANPWQMGAYVCYDLKQIFENKVNPFNGSVANNELNIAADTFLNTKAYKNLLYFRWIKNKTMFDYDHKFVFNPDSLMFSNPSYYDTYRILGDYYAANNKKLKAEEMYKIALEKEIATQKERASIQEKIKLLKE